MLRLDVDAERTEAAVVCRAQLVRRDVFRGLEERVAHLFRRFDRRGERVHDTDEGDLLDAVGVAPDRAADLFIHGRFGRFAGELDQEVAGVDLEERRQQCVVRHVGRVHAVAVAAWARVDSDVGALGRREAVYGGELGGGRR